ncbi:MAG: glycosyltransferase family 1 protein [Abditibacteriaceae bacterium]
MKVLYDGLIFNTQFAGGINRYIANLIDGLPNDISPTVTTCRIPAVNWPQNPRLKVLRYSRFRPRRISRRIERAFFNLVTGSHTWNVFHPTYYSSLIERDWSSYQCPVVLTVHDLIHERFAELTDPTGAQREEKRKAIQSANAILCVSEHTKRDLMEYYAVPESKITVTYGAAGLSADLSHGEEPIPSRPYFLYVGSRASYKNFDGLLQALSRIVTSHSDFALCIVGPPLTDAENKMIEDLKLGSHIEYYGHASDSQLAKLYRCSLAFVYPSLYEGFGIPPLEAMQCGTIVVASNTSSIPEVVGDAGISFDPRNIGNLTDILLSILNGSVKREDFIAKGYQQAQKFNWAKTVKQTVEVYRSFAD